jgi:hypothetical protein
VKICFLLIFFIIDQENRAVSFPCTFDIFIFSTLGFLS